MATRRVCWRRQYCLTWRCMAFLWNSMRSILTQAWHTCNEPGERVLLPESSHGRSNRNDVGRSRARRGLLRGVDGCLARPTPHPSEPGGRKLSDTGNPPLRVQVAPSIILKFHAPRVFPLLRRQSAGSPRPALHLLPSRNPAPPRPPRMPPPRSFRPTQAHRPHPPLPR